MASTRGSLGRVPQGEKLFQGFELVTSKSKGCFLTVAPRLTITLKNQLRTKNGFESPQFFLSCFPSCCEIERHKQICFCMRYPFKLLLCRKHDRKIRRGSQSKKFLCIESQNGQNKVQFHKCQFQML